jgi:hypothetical protein
MNKKILLVNDPIVAPMAHMQLIPEGVAEMARWVQRNRPNCVPEGGFEEPLDLVPHDGWEPIAIDGVPVLCLRALSPHDELQTEPDHKCMKCGVALRGHPVGRRVTDNELLAELGGTTQPPRPARSA